MRPKPPTKVVTPVKVDRLRYYLRHYQQGLRDKIIKGFTFGFRISSMNFHHCDTDKNLQSARILPQIIEEKINKENSLGRFSGPYEIPPYDNFIISPLGLREKKVPGEYRVIHNLSYPYDETSVNANIPREEATVQYASIVDAIQIINKFGRNCYLAKTDIKSAFRIIPVHPEDRHLLGFKWKGNYYFDNCLPMGCSSSCQLFECFSTALEWIVSNYLPKVGIIHVLDDFLFVTESKESCQIALDTFVKICKDLGVPLAPEKTMGPSQSLPFVGIQLDTVDMVASLPEDKVVKYVGLLDDFLLRKSVKLTELQSLTGMLNFACGIICPARAFNRRLYDLTIGISKPYYRIKLTKEVKLDLAVWRNFLVDYNYQTFLLDYIWVSNNHLQLFTDASSTIGFGGVFGKHWFYGLWSESCLRLNIALLELYPICLALHIWGPSLANRCININCDNQAVVCIINSCTSKDKFIMILVRKLVYICMHYNILIRAKHISGVSNVIPDLISRNKFQKALELDKSLERHPIDIPMKWNLEKWLEN